MDPSNGIKLLNEKQQQGLAQCLQRTEQWEKIKDDYHVLKTRLESLADRLSYEVMVPFGSQAFIPGRIVNTNEILVLLGGDWFVERSTKQAAEIAERRISHCDKMLEGLAVEKKQFENWMKLTSEELGNQDKVEIVEEYDAEKEKEWREQHRERVRAHRQKGSKIRKVNFKDGTAANDVKGHAALMERLKTLELEEENEEQTEIVKNDKSDDSVTETNPAGVTETSPVGVTETNPVPLNKQESIEQPAENKKNVRWIDQEVHRPVTIIFRHSSNSSDFNHAIIDGSRTLNSPSDIYKMFKTDNIKPILKVKNSSPVDDTKVNTTWTKCVGSTGADMAKSYYRDYTGEGIYEDDVLRMEESKPSCSAPAFTGEVQERPTKYISESSSSASSSRPVSQFKKQRTKKN